MNKLICATALAALLPACLSAAPLGTAFIYQGRLTDGTGPANGSYDLQFSIHDMDSGALVAGPLINPATTVADGLFTITLDFGSGVFTGNALCLDIGVRTNGSTGKFTLLTPRQPLSANPYASYAASAPAAGLSGTLSLAQLPGQVLTNNAGAVSLAGSFSGNGSGLGGLNASELAVGQVPDGRLAANVARTSQVWLLGVTDLIGVIKLAELASLPFEELCRTGIHICGQIAALRS